MRLLCRFKWCQLTSAMLRIPHISRCSPVGVPPMALRQAVHSLEQESTRTPMESLAGQVSDWTALVRHREALAGMGVEVDPEAIRRALAQATAGLAGGRGEVPTAGAALAGSREAYSAILQHQLGRGEQTMPRDVALALGVLRQLLRESQELNAVVKGQEVDVIDLGRS